MTTDTEKTVFLLGIGPGDPGLVTVRAARVLAQADCIYAPRGGASEHSVAERIIAEYADAAKIRLCEIPMTKSGAGAQAAYARLAREIAGELAVGKRVAFVTLGDSMVYSTAQNLAAHLEREGVAHEYVAGIPSFVAAADRVRISLAGRTERFLVTPMPDSLEEVAELAARADTVVFMKISGRIGILQEYARQSAPSRAVLVYRLGQEEEEIFDLAKPEDLPESVGYLSTAIVRK